MVVDGTLSAAVIGGSLGGLTAALVLLDLGLDVHLFERSPRPLSGRGAGIVLHPITERYLRERHGVDVGRLSTSSRRLRYVDANGSELSADHCAYRFTAWDTLYRALAERLPAERHHRGQQLAALEQDGELVTVRLASGAARRFDLVVCADGVHSTGRRLLFPEAVPVYSGYVAWRGTVAEDEVSERTRRDLAEDITYHLMPNSHILGYPIPGPAGELEPGRRQLNFVWYRNVADGEERDDLMTGADGTRRELSVPPGQVAERHVGELREAASTLPPSLREVVQATEFPFIQEIVDVFSPGMAMGRVCLLGDAAFVARPHAAAGTAKAAADAWALHDSLSRIPSDPPAALAAYERSQMPVALALMDRVRELGDASQFGAGWTPGDPRLLFGLFRPGDSEITQEDRCPRPT